MSVWIIHPARTANMTDEPPPDIPLADAGRYDRLSQARERGLVVSAMELPHWIVREGRTFVLRVEVSARESVARELEVFEAEQAQRAAIAAPERVVTKIETLSLYVAAWCLSAFWLAQNLMPQQWQDAGEAVSASIARKGEWWRAATALTLHGDLSHLVANLASGLLFAAFVLPHLGTGLTWLAIVACGFLGNVMNAFFYRDTGHISIGSSTAVFGALGLLVACEFIARLCSAATRSRWQLILPIGAGLGLLAYLGSGDEAHKQTDYMAHLWGFVAGLIVGLAMAVTSIPAKATRNAQRIAAIIAPLVLVIAWWMAVKAVPG